MSGIDFALGFIAGEATFTLDTTFSGVEKPYCKPHFGIHLHERDHYLLQEVREICGNIGTFSHNENDNTITWYVSSMDDLQKFRDLIQEGGAGAWFASEKYNSFLVWSDMVDVYCRNYNSTDQDRVDMAAIACRGELNVGAGKTDADYQRILDWYAENQNTYPDADTN
jgi:hypothetical protein